MKRSKLWMTLVSAMVTLSVTGCGSMDILKSKKIDYKSASTVPTLEVPPDLTAPTADSRYQVPDLNPRGSATYSAYHAERSENAGSGKSDILPTESNVRIERAGSERWLVVNMPPEKVWPIVKDFWQENGFVINVEDPQAGIMETDWAENRAKIPQDMIRNLLGKVVDNLYSTPERDKFRTRLERTTNPPGGTEIYISHRGMVEVYTGNSFEDKSTVWQPRPADPGLEAEMLSRLMERFGVAKAQAKAMLAEQNQPDRAKLAKAGDGSPMLALTDPFDRAWRRVGLALDRINFTVEDRNRAKGIYYVRYIDPQDDVETKQSTGFLSKLAFWRSSKKTAAHGDRYQIEVSENQAANGSDVRVLTAQGTQAKAETANKIFKLLLEQLK
ncbi:MAG: outer membrane protein assembly factor BamC [Pseudomonadota bacterium]